MKKVSVILLAVLFLGLSLNSCKKEKNNKDVLPIDVLSGTWQLTKLEFSVMPSSGFPASDACIMEIVSGYEFRTDNKLFVILGDDGFFDPYAKDYWTWSGDNSQFEIIQNNPASPPYNFSLQPRNIQFERSGDTWLLNFESNMKNGSTARFQLRKQELQLDKNPVVTDPEGNPYQCNFFGQ